MSRVNRCEPDGWVSGTPAELPKDPSVFEWRDRSPLVACNHLVCQQCKEEVRSQTGYLLELDSEHRVERATRLYTTEDWSSIAGIEHEENFRLYACRCFYHSAYQPELTFNHDSPDPTTGQVTRNLPWTCSGHPPVKLPVTLGDRTIADAAGLASAIAAAASDPAQADAIIDLYFRSHHGPLEAVVPDALATVFAGPASMPLAVKALFEAHASLAPLTATTEELMRYQTGIAKAAPTRREQLIDILASAVRQRPARIPESGTLTLLRDEALHGITTAALLRLFEVEDGDWFVAHFETMLAKQPSAPGGILARAGRALLFRTGNQAAVLNKLTKLAHDTSVPSQTLLAQARSALDVRLGVLPEDQPIIDAITS